jgi:hypothetical protein
MKNETRMHGYDGAKSIDLKEQEPKKSLRCFEKVMEYFDDVLTQNPRVY